MLLVGSRAARFHFEDFRAPKDWDVFATREELARVRTLLPSLPSSWAKKECFRYEDNVLEVGIADEGTTNHALLREARGRCTLPLLGDVDVASPEALLFLKRSHLPFMIHWWKSIEDVRFLRARVRLGPRWRPLLDQRLEETKEQLLPEQRIFPRERGQVCAAPPGGRYVHEQLHAIVAPRGRRGSFASLPRRAQLQVLAEETMVIALERFYLTAAPSAPRPLEGPALLCAYQHLILHALSFELREMATDAIDDVLALVPRGFSRGFEARLDARLPDAGRLDLSTLLPHHA